MCYVSCFTRQSSSSVANPLFVGAVSVACVEDAVELCLAQHGMDVCIAGSLSMRPRLGTGWRCRGAVPYRSINSQHTGTKNDVNALCFRSTFNVSYTGVWEGSKMIRCEWYNEGNRSGQAE